jgi:hypothetical protein
LGRDVEVLVILLTGGTKKRQPREGTGTEALASPLVSG